jgi:hypothetical protein
MDKRDFQEEFRRAEKRLRRIFFLRKLKAKLSEFAVEAICGFAFWTAFLTPYMILVVKTTLEQYAAWVAMEVVLVTPLAPLVINLTNMVKRRFRKRKRDSFENGIPVEWFK